MARIAPVALFQAAAILARDHYRPYLRLAALPFVVSLGCGTAAVMLAPPPGAPPGQPAANLWALMLSGLLTIVVTIPMVTAWHRFVILGHGQNTQWLRWRWGRAEWGSTI